MKGPIEEMLDIALKPMRDDLRSLVREQRNPATRVANKAKAEEKRQRRRERNQRLNGGAA